MPGAVFMLGGSMEGDREEEPGGTAELEDEDGRVPEELPPELPVVDCDCAWAAAALASAKATARAM